MNVELQFVHFLVRTYLTKQKPIISFTNEGIWVQGHITIGVTKFQLG